MRRAKVVNDNDIFYQWIYRQAINGYAGIYKNEWLVGRYTSNQIIKVHYSEFLSKGSFLEIQEKIDMTRSKAVSGLKLKKMACCKFTYDITNQNLFSIHTNLEKNYCENEMAEDCGHYGGLHFVTMNNVNACFEHGHTAYGNKIAIIQPCDDAIYYEYMEGVFIGNRVYVQKIMKMSEIATWMYMLEQSAYLKENSNIVIEYLEHLNCLEKTKKYNAAINYIRLTYLDWLLHEFKV